MSNFDAVVIGTDGMAAAALMAKAGAHVLLLRQPGEQPYFGPLHALDPRLIAALNLTRHGLTFLHRDLPRIGLSDDPACHPALVLPREHHLLGRALAGSPDARTWPPLQRRLFAQARALRRWWDHPMTAGAPAALVEGRAARARFRQQQWWNAEAFLAAHLESEMLRAMLLFDAVAGGFAPSEPGTALALTWRMAQEMAGLQGATALARPGWPERALMLAAREAGVEIAEARVTGIVTDNGRAAAVMVDQVGLVDTRAVVSALPRGRTLALMGAPDAVEYAPVGEARLLLTLKAPHGLAAGRHILAGGMAHQADAYDAACAGRLIADPPLEATPVAPDQLAVTLRPVPLACDGAQLAALAVKALGRHVPGLALAALDMRRPFARTRATLSRMTAPALARAATPAPNMVLCGPDAEPVHSLSGRSCRFAAGFVSRTL